MRILVFLFVLLMNPSVSASPELLKPFREGSSSYVSSKDEVRARKYLKSRALSVVPEAKAVLLENLESDLPELVSSLESLLGPKVRDPRKALSSILVLCRAHNEIDDIIFRLLRDSVEEKYPTQTEIDRRNENPGPAMELKTYLTKKSALLRRFGKKGSLEVPKAPFPKKKFSFTVEGHRNLSALEMVFYKYDSRQIEAMARIMELALNVADAESVVTTVNFRNSDPLILVHTATDQYRLALRLMRIKKSEAERDSLQIGRPVKDIELIIAAYLAGIIGEAELSLILEDENFYRPEVAMEVKALKFLGGLALMGLKLNPATAPYVIVPIILYNFYNESKKLKKAVDEDSFVFTLPGAKS